MKFKVEFQFDDKTPKEEVELMVKNLFHSLQVDIWEHYKIKRKDLK